ncbi:DNA photolyase, FAD-binding/Cryptochrome [Entophlyctis helioformis]|nr:DNA photolyase, FAD-binding/Cryptochrome [Entophlyctis helioformis]
MRIPAWFPCVHLPFVLCCSDNPALFSAVATGRPVVALFVLAPAFWASHNEAHIKIDFILRSLAALAPLLSALSIPLVVRNAPGRRDIPATVVDTVRALDADTLFCNIEYELDETVRDRNVQDLLARDGVAMSVSDCQSVVAPHRIRTNDGKICHVFTPYKNKWIPIVASEPQLLDILPVPPPVQSPLSPRALEYAAQHTSIPTSVLRDDLRRRALADWPPGQHVAQSLLTDFLAHRSSAYKTDRDYPAKHAATSRLSTYLVSGAISTKMCVRYAVDANAGRLDSGNPGLVHWISELVWREFYRYILVAYPRLCKGQAFKLDTEHVAWSYDQTRFDAWCAGMTGYPIVDAAMRQLNTTGWMSNRGRMIAAMFLTKDLLIDWRWGEKYFAMHLIDGDFASNNGGWQWSASTGTDSQPYFRVFNPLLQSRKFDGAGDYIREFVPELRGLPPSAIHAPADVLSAAEFAKLGYPRPIVDHAAARLRCIEAFKKAAVLAG